MAHNLVAHHVLPPSSGPLCRRVPAIHVAMWGVSSQTLLGTCHQNNSLGAPPPITKKAAVAASPADGSTWHWATGWTAGAPNPSKHAGSWAREGVCVCVGMRGFFWGGGVCVCACVCACMDLFWSVCVCVCINLEFLLLLLPCSPRMAACASVSHGANIWKLVSLDWLFSSWFLFVIYGCLHQERVSIGDWAEGAISMKGKAVTQRGGIVIGPSECS